MFYSMTSLFISFFVQLAVCITDKKVIIKLIPLIIELAVAVCLIIPALIPLIDTDTRIVIAFYALVALGGITGIGLAWIICAAVRLISLCRVRSKTSE